AFGEQADERGVVVVGKLDRGELGRRGVRLRGPARPAPARARAEPGLDEAGGGEPLQPAACGVAVDVVVSREIVRGHGPFLAAHEREGRAQPGVSDGFEAIHNLDLLSVFRRPVSRRAGGRTRTDALAITNRALYQLSYSGRRSMVGNPEAVRSRRGPAEAYATVTTWSTRRTSETDRRSRSSSRFASSATRSCFPSAKTRVTTSASSVLKTCGSSNARLADYSAAPFGSEPLAATTTIRTRRPTASTTTAKSTSSPSIAPKQPACTSSRSAISMWTAQHHFELHHVETTSRSGFDSPPTTRSGGSLLKNFAGLLVRDDLPLHALERVVDRLRVASELLGHVLVRRALEVEAQGIRLEIGEPGAETEDEA